MFRRMIPLALLCLLALATSASAECAWVLWSYSLSQGADLHRVELARSTRKECEEEASAFAATLKLQGYKVSGRVPGSPEVTGRKGTDRVTYSCSPTL
jgi:hypothetical protein